MMAKICTAGYCNDVIVVALQREYIRGISAWNFNLEDLKTQAALVRRSTLSLMPALIE